MTLGILTWALCSVLTPISLNTTQTKRRLLSAAFRGISPDNCSVIRLHVDLGAVIGDGSGRGAGVETDLRRQKSRVGRQVRRDLLLEYRARNLVHHAHLYRAGTNWGQLIVPEDRDVALGHLVSARRGEATEHEFRIRRPSDGTFRWIRDHDFPLLTKPARSGSAVSAQT